MPLAPQLFVADHHAAVAYAKALDAGRTPPNVLESYAVPDVTDLDLEILGELAVRKVHATGTECALGMVDVELDSLLVIPEGLDEVFAELKDLEDPEELAELAAEWAGTEEMSTTADVTESMVRRISELAAAAGADERLALYFWSE
ncbi:MAG: hypothetical protein ACHP7K_05875 [Actinomycetales bacterium]